MLPRTILPCERQLSKTQLTGEIPLAAHTSLPRVVHVLWLRPVDPTTSASQVLLALLSSTLVYVPVPGDAPVSPLR